MRPLTLRQLASEAQVSPAAMSCALNGTGNLSDATRARLRAFAKARGYVPRPALAALSALRSNRAAVVSPLPVIVLGKLDNDLHRAASELGYRLVGQAPAIDPAGVKEHAARIGAAGVIIARSDRIPQWLETDWHPLAVVVCYSGCRSAGYHHVAGRVFSGLLLAWARMTALGWHRIGAVILRHQPEIDDDAERLGACLAAQQTLSRDAEAIPPCRAKFDQAEEVLAWFERWRPDAVLGFHPRISDMLSSRFGTVPFASLHIDPRDHRRRRIAGLLVDPRAQARMSMRILDTCIRHHDVGRPEFPVITGPPPRWRDGPSLPRRS